MRKYLYICVMERLVQVAVEFEKEQYLTIQQSLKIFRDIFDQRISLSTIYRWIYEGKINAVKVLGRVLIPVSEIERVSKAYNLNIQIQRS